MLRFALPAVVLCLVGAGPVGSQEVRFEIATVGDSTFTFGINSHRWIGKGMRGIAVDPRRRDALVARFTVLSRDGACATALVTAQTTRVSTEHVALLERPPRRWYSQALFWIGLATGAALGALVASVR